MDDQLFNQLKELIVSKLNISDPSIVVPEARFREDLHADSLDTYELVYAIEEQMNITIPPEKVSTFERVQDAVEYIASKIK